MTKSRGRILKKRNISKPLTVDIVNEGRVKVNFLLAGMQAEVSTLKQFRQKIRQHLHLLQIEEHLLKKYIEVYDLKKSPNETDQIIRQINAEMKLNQDTILSNLGFTTTTIATPINSQNTTLYSADSSQTPNTESSSSFITAETNGL